MRGLISPDCFFYNIASFFFPQTSSLPLLLFRRWNKTQRLLLLLRRRHRATSLLLLLLLGSQPRGRGHLRQEGRLHELLPLLLRLAGGGGGEEEEGPLQGAAREADVSFFSCKNWEQDLPETSSGQDLETKEKPPKKKLQINIL